MSFDTALKESLDKIFDPYKKCYDRIYDLKAGEAKELSEDLIEFCTNRKWDITAVLLIISNAAECNLMNLRGYWELFKNIYNRIKIKPPINTLKPYIAILFAKEYQVYLNKKFFQIF